MNIINNGDFDAYPIIILKGRLDAPIITNETTGESLIFSGNVSSGDIYTVDIVNRTIVNSAGDNIFSVLSSDTDWPVIVPGVNIFSSKTFAADGNTLVTIKFRSAWL